MNHTLNKSDLKESFLSILSSLETTKENGGSAVPEKKKKAKQVFESLGFPTSKNEEWKYTNIAPALKHDYALETNSSADQKTISSFFYEGLKANKLVFLNGQFSPEYSEITDKSALTIKSFSETSPDLLEKYFAKESGSPQDGLSALNTAFAANGIFISILKGKAPETPLSLHFISDAASHNIFSQPRILLVAEENSQVKVIESFHTIGGNHSFTNIVSEIHLEKNAHIEYYKIQQDAPHSYHTGTTQVFQEAKSHFSATTLTLDGAIVRNNLNIVMQDKNCEATLYGLYMADGSKHIDNHTLVDHAMPDCLSNELYKGLLDGNSTGVFNGKILVRQDAQKTNAFQSNKNILLSKDATMNTKPQLEIFADDVKCSHGSTIGKLDEEPLFYLRARGISEAKARAMLIFAFVSDVLEHIKIESLRSHFEKMVGQKLGQN